MTAKRATSLTRLNATKHGVLAAGLLPWEEANEFRLLLDALIAEHDPRGMTETSLVQDLAWIIWRRRRVALAEAAAHRRRLAEVVLADDVTVAALAHLGVDAPPEPAIAALHATPQETARDVRRLAEVEASVYRALELLAPPDPQYAAAVAALDEEVRARWPHDEQPAGPHAILGPQAADTAAAAYLKAFLEDQVLPGIELRRIGVENRPDVCTQVAGEAFDVEMAERLMRYETALDRRLGRTLSMLMQLQALRRETSAA